MLYIIQSKYFKIFDTDSFGDGTYYSERFISVLFAFYTHKIKNNTRCIVNSMLNFNIKEYSIMIICKGI